LGEITPGGYRCYRCYRSSPDLVRIGRLLYIVLCSGGRAFAQARQAPGGRLPWAE